ncbi:coenzyme F420-0:L-glutamate ligase [Demequina sp. SYSU T00192]|uniref:Coenzyme F420-0:L-glutamate ligase n=1 Tax=Demequina litoralis TaxID=3051660 RepID=A0ABT8G828_9MICO|nr:coenzyme F420-0:L-glutamate ligase [Demequina sp. SYSU T00192]MDN4475303.1 coenzyme F420-0:L-glutamate ligase [Demequina sp. SYSU T00192]
MPGLSVWSVEGVGEVVPGDDLADLIARALDRAGETLADGDVLVVASKIVSKAEGRLVPAEDREDAITAEAVRVVASRPRRDGGATRIVETRHGFVMAAAGVDASNVPAGHVLLLPVDPDGSARTLAAGLRGSSGARIGVIVTDTFGRPWRQGQTDLAIGAAHVRVVADHRGGHDAHGRPMTASVTALVDEIAAAADLVKGKAGGLPVAVVRGLDVVTDEAGPGVASLVRGAESDMFRLGSDEAFAAGHAAGLRMAQELGERPVGEHAPETRP